MGGGAGGTYGGFSPQPERYGGGRRNIEFILDHLLQSDVQEVGLDVTHGSCVWVEEVATARAINSAQNTNERGANEFDPRRMQSMLPRWETIFGVVPPLNSTLPLRRKAITFKFNALGKSPTPGQIMDDLTYLATTSDGESTIFVGITNTSSATGPSYFPGSSFPNPYVIGGATVVGSLVDWWSAVLNVCVNVVMPAGMSETVYNDLIGAMSSYLDGTLPAWCTFCFAQSTGFFLDQANLSVEAFAT